MSIRILSELCSIPTAPFAEGRVIEYVRRFVSARRKLKLTEDRFGNLLIELPGKLRSPRLVFVAHMDHPGLVAQKMHDARTVYAAFHGGVHNEYVAGAKVRFFDAEREVAGAVIGMVQDEESSVFPSAVMVKVRYEVRPGTPGMFDLGATRIRGKRFLSRVCDDLAGAASALTMLDRLLKHPPEATVAVLLTRAEESGFIGAIASVLHPTLLRKSDRIISIECSAVQPYAPQGNGVILRVGDRTSIFNSGFMYFIHQRAEALMKRNKQFKYQRLLMPGGTCEATVFDAFGYVTGAVCVPLGNYHNMDRVSKKLGPEYIDLDDWKNMVELHVQLARSIHSFEPGNKALRSRVKKRFARHRHLLGRA
jgi:endoglucanase